MDEPADPAAELDPVELLDPEPPQAATPTASAAATMGAMSLFMSVAYPRFGRENAGWAA